MVLVILDVHGVEDIRELVEPLHPQEVAVLKKDPLAVSKHTLRVCMLLGLCDPSKLFRDVGRHLNVVVPDMVLALKRPEGLHEVATMHPLPEPDDIQRAFGTDPAVVGLVIVSFSRWVVAGRGLVIALLWVAGHEAA